MFRGAAIPGEQEALADGILHVRRKYGRIPLIQKGVFSHGKRIFL